MSITTDAIDKLADAEETVVDHDNGDVVILHLMSVPTEELIASRQEGTIVVTSRTDGLHTHAV